MEKLKVTSLFLLTLAALTGVGLSVAERFAPKVPPQWEYMSLPVEATGGYAEMSDGDINPDQTQLDALGRQGWELVDVITELETAHPNFGNSQYVTGLQPNTRADRAVLLFKRQVQPGQETQTEAAGEAEPGEASDGGS